MTRRPMLLLTVLLVVATTEASAQDAADVEAARTAVLRAMDAKNGIAEYCFKAADTDATAMVVKVEDLAASALVPGAGVATILNPVKVGSLTYRGKGIRITSDDPRFADLRVDPATWTLRLPDGDRLVTSNLVHAKGGGECRLALTPYKPPSPSLLTLGPLSERAARAGARAHLPGYRAIDSLPYGRDRFITLMHPESGRDRTLIVTFAAQNDTRIEAETPLAFQSFTFNPPLHIGSWSLGLIGRQPDGSVVQLALEAEPSFP